MCGIFGYVSTGQHANLSRGDIERVMRQLYRLSESRGKEAAGIALNHLDRMAIYKDNLPASEMLNSKGFKAFLDRTFGKDGTRLNPGASLAYIAHTRLVTNGNQTVDENNQPTQRGNVAMVHNGIIVNYDELADEHELQRTADVDTEVAALLLNKEIESGKSLPAAIRKVMDSVFGETTIASLFRDRSVMALATNTGSLFVVHKPDSHELFFVSERYMAQEAISANKSLKRFHGAEVTRINPGEIALIDTETLQTVIYKADEKVFATPSFASKLIEHRDLEVKHLRFEELRQSLRRCTRCILPETIPFIEFDENGVCNYCHTYKSIDKSLFGKKALEKKLEHLDRLGADANSIVAFSGGRDSSYSLHLMVKEWGLRPVAYTYDWGMVTDLGRRNQARMCHQLGVEHIWISADIRAKRRNIRRNVNAWLRRPSLGTIPLFMAGDKQYFYFANQVMEQCRLDTLIMGANRLERTDFKSGFAGVKPSVLKELDTSTPFHRLSLAGVAKMFAYYGKEVLMNPAYMNLSVPDTLNGFWSYYLMKQPHLDVFEYLPWREDVVDDILINGYDWETAVDADATWRIGDGTAPFYNYIYNHVTGFTEFDSMRSNQIREGHITREEGLALANRDNQPRYESIREYFSMINGDFEAAMKAVGKMDVLYDPDLRR
jgi:asparagine synthetase B (glutamine-hydrolysing)